MNEIGSYSSPLTLGHKALEGFWNGQPVYVQEKIDGSQISFSFNGEEVVFRSRGKMIDKSAPDMFDRAVEAIQGIHERVGLIEGWTYRGEYLSKRKHNTLEYARVPENYVILYDIDRGNQDYISPQHGELSEEAQRLGLQTAPYLGLFTAPVQMQWLELTMSNISVLGGCTIEGVVLKNYSLYGPDKKVLMAKYVSPAFKEKHTKDWKERHPSNSDFVDSLIEEYKTEARWEKAVQHLREAGQIEGTPQDIGILLREVGADILGDSEEEIKEKLFKHFWKKIQRGVTRGLPEWYKNKLAEESLK